MVEMGEAKRPYNPDMSVNPKDFVGRQSILNEVKKKVEVAVKDGNGGGALFYGDRGIGKTSLLDKIEDEYKSHEEITIIKIDTLKTDSETSSDGLYQAIASKILKLFGDVKLREKLASLELKGPIVSFILGIFSSGNTDIEHAWDKYKVDPTLSDTYFSLIQVLKEVKGDKLKALIIEIDNADLIADNARPELKTIGERSKNYGVPALVILTSNKKFDKNLKENHSEMRLFSDSKDISAFQQREEIEDILLKPITNAHKKNGLKKG